MSDISLEKIKKQIQEKEQLFNRGKQERGQLLKQRDQILQQLNQKEADLIGLQGQHKALVDLLPEEKPEKPKPELKTVKNKKKKKR